ncbi:MAG: MmcQ/YjbR family DNA-binding protein [Treponema sp.]|nr:MmcQ/YjbR family DNA-binding protein [Treponema sp.]
MNYNQIFSSSVAKVEAFADFGFTLQADSSYLLKIKLSQEGFYAVFHLNVTEASLEVHVYDEEERYPLFDSLSSHGSFVVSLRNEVQTVIEDLKKKCFTSSDLREDFFAFVKEKFSVIPEYPWKPEKAESQGEDSGFKNEAYADYAVFRCPNNKWFALLGHISYKQLGFSGDGTDEKIWCVNLKAVPDEIPSLVDRKSIFPAFHMNKKHWITVALSGVTDLKKLFSLAEKSYSLVMGKKK